MARQGWGGSVATAIGVAAGASAAQLGFGYGLGIIDWAPPEGATDSATWVAGLIWATWIAATSTVAGAVCAQRLRDRATATDTANTTGALGAVLLAVAAGLGASITVLLVAVPARMAVVPEVSSPRSAAASYAAVGLLLGVLAAVWTLRSRAAATNVLATVGWLWALAVTAVLDNVLAGRGLTSAQLGIWQLSADAAGYWIRDWFYWPGAVLSLGSALLIGALAARRAARHPTGRVGAAASGGAGPLLVAVAYLLAVPGLNTIQPQQVSAHLIAPYAVIVGIGGSVLVAALAQRAARRATPAASNADAPGSRPDEPGSRPDERAADGGAAGTETVEVTPVLLDSPAAAHPDPKPARSGPDPEPAANRPDPADPARPVPTSPRPDPVPAESATATEPTSSPGATTPSVAGGPPVVPAQRTGAEPVPGSGGDVVAEPTPATKRARAPRRTR